MADGSVSMATATGNRSIRRAVTLPSSIPPLTKSSATPVEGLALHTEETLFSCSTSKIVAFNTTTRNRSPGQRRRSQDDDPMGVLPWTSHTERTLATGPIRLYRVPGLSAYLHSGRTTHPILSKSQCWCVDGETIFVLKIRGNHFWRIEMPNSTPEDASAAARFKLALSKVLQYESTPCPFKREFHVELPEKPEVTLRPWKPKHSPIAPLETSDLQIESFQMRAGSMKLDNSEGGWTKTGLPHVTTTGDGWEDSPSSDDLATVDPQDEREDPLHYVETVVSTYESMAASEAAPTQQISEVILNKQSLETSDAVAADSSDALKFATSDQTCSVPNTGNASYQGQEIVSSSEEDLLSKHRFSSGIANQVAVSDVDDVAELSIPKLRKQPAEKDPEYNLPNARGFVRSFTAPTSYLEPDYTEISATKEQRQPLTFSGPDATPSRMGPFTVPNTTVQDRLCHTFGDVASGQVEEHATMEFSGTAQPGEIQSINSRKDTAIEYDYESTSSESRSPTPEWLDLSPETSNYLPPVEMPLHNVHSTTMSSQHLSSYRDCSPSSQLRQRLHQRRAHSPMPSPSVLQIPSAYHPKRRLAVEIMQQTYLILASLITQLIAFFMQISRSSRIRLLDTSGTDGHVSDGRLPCSWESEGSSDEFASISSEDDFGISLDGRSTFETK